MKQILLVLVLVMTASAHRYYDAETGRWTSVDSAGQYFNPYAYVGNAPINNVDPSGLWGFGWTWGGTADAGSVDGAGATVSEGKGSFVGKDGCSTGSFFSYGAYAGGPDGAKNYPVGNEKDDGTIGAYAGGGAGLFLTNANSVRELGGPFKTTMINTPLFSIQFGSSSGTWIFSITGGPGVGADVSTYSTNTKTR